jgi:galacturonosyltransferase
MKVLISINCDIGLYKFRLELIERLINERYEVYISSPNGEYIEELVKIGCKYYEVDLSRHGVNPIKEIGLIKHYKKLVRVINPDIVLTYTIKPNVYMGIVCQKLGIPYISNITGLGTAVENPGLKQNIAIILYKIALRKAKRVYFQNYENMQFFKENKIALGKHKLIPGSGVNLERFKLKEYPNDENGVVRFAFISRIMKEKGIDQYLEAAAAIHEKYPKTCFHICGFCEQAYETKISELSQKGIIRYHGMVDDVREILKQTHCTVHPTYYPEGLSNVLLESSACARPIITTNRPGCREVIDDSINGFIVKEKDSADLIEKIEKFLLLSYEQKREMGLRGREKVEHEFDRNIVVQKYLKEITSYGL